MQLRHIEVCHAVFQTGAISRAAQLLGISQPAASKLVKHAEQRLGFPLFERIRGRLVPTREGKLLAAEIDKLFCQLTQVQRLSQNLLAREQEHLRIGCLPCFGFGLVPQAIQQFQSRHPSLTYKVHTQHGRRLVEALLSQEIDVGIALDPIPTAGIHMETLGTAELVCVQSKQAKPQNGEMQLTDLDLQRLIGLEEGDPLGRKLDVRLRQLGLAAAPAVRVQTYYIACALAEKDCGTAVIDAFTAQAFSNSGITISRITPAIQFEVVALYNELVPQSRICAEFISRVGAIVRQRGSIEAKSKSELTSRLSQAEHSRPA